MPSSSTESDAQSDATEAEKPDPPVTEVLLKRDDGGSTQCTELGLVLGANAKTKEYRYLTASGEAVTAQGSTFLQAKRGSMIHLLRGYADSVAEILAEYPVAVFTQLVSEQPNGADAGKLKADLTSAGIDSALVDREWKKAQKALKGDDEFAVDGKTYVKKHDRPLRRELLEFITIPEYPVIEHGVERSAEAGTTTETDAGAQGSVDPGAPADEPPPADLETGVTTHDDRAPVETDAPAPHPAAAESSASGTTIPRRTPLVAALADMGIYVNDVMDVRSQVLSIATQLSALNGIPEKPRKLPKSQQDIWDCLYLAVPSKTRERTTVISLARSATDKLLNAALDELDAADDSTRARLAPSALGLTSNLLLGDESAGVSIRLLTRAATVLGVLPHPTPYRDVFGEVVTLLAGKIAATKDREKLADVTTPPRFDQFTASLATLPISRQPRTSLLLALHRRAPAVLTDERWWRGCTAMELANAVSGPLYKVLDDVSVMRDVVAPKLASALETTSKRSELFGLAASPDVIVRMISDAQFKQSLTHVAQNDPVVAGWLRLLTHSNEVDALKGALADSQHRSETLERQKEELARSVDQLRDERGRLLERVRSTREASGSAQEARDRQTRLATLRSLAELAACVAVSTGADDPVLSQRVEALTSNEGLSSIGHVGATAAYDPALHDPQGQRLERGSTVTVVRPGYNVRDGGQAHVLIKARITA